MDRMTGCRFRRAAGRGFILLLLILVLSAAACAGRQGEISSPPEPEETPVPEGYTEYFVTELYGRITVPDDYYVFGEEIDYTEEMCRESGLEPDQMKQYLELSPDQVQIIPRGESFTDPSIKFLLYVNHNEHPSISFDRLSEEEYKVVADSIIAKYEGLDYTTVEHDGIRFMVFGDGKVLRYATVLDSSMIYIYAVTSGAEITPAEKAVLEGIALSLDLN